MFYASISQRFAIKTYGRCGSKLETHFHLRIEKKRYHDVLINSQNHRESFSLQMQNSPINNLPRQLGPKISVLEAPSFLSAVVQAISISICSWTSCVFILKVESYLQKRNGALKHTGHGHTGGQQTTTLSRCNTLPRVQVCSGSHDSHCFKSVASASHQMPEQNHTPFRNYSLCTANKEQAVWGLLPCASSLHISQHFCKYPNRAPTL